MPASPNPRAKAILKASAGAWGLLAELLEGRPWPEEAIRFDLAMLSDAAHHPKNPTPLPGRRALAKRWGVGEKVARRLLREVDPMAKGPTEVPPGSHEGPAEVPPETEQRQQNNHKGPTGVPPRSHEGPTEGHTRVDLLSPASCTLPSASKNNTPLARVTKAYRAHHPRRWKTKPAAGVAQRIREHGADDVIKVIEWAHNSNHQRARMLRDGGHLGETLFRPSKFEEYLEFAESPTAGRPRMKGEWAGPDIDHDTEENWAHVQGFVDDIARDRPE